MPWLGYAVGLFVGTTFGFWIHDFWAGDLTGVGSPPPPAFDLYVPAGMFVLATALLIVVSRRTRPSDRSRAAGADKR